MTRLLALLPAALLLAAAGPSVEHGPAQERLFAEACQGEGLSRAACSCASERLQAALGYEAFVEVAGEGPAGFRDRPALAPRALEAHAYCVGMGEASVGAQTRVAALR